MNAGYDHKIKLLIIGDSGVGKSCILLRYVDNKYSEDFSATIGIDNKSKIVIIDKLKYKLHIWDTAGQERFRTVTSSYYRGAHGIMVVYSISDEESFHNIKKWLQEIDRYACEDVRKIIVGNMMDDKSKREVDYNAGLDLADRYNIDFIETSAKSGENIEEAFMTLATAVIPMLDGESTASVEVEKTFPLNTNEQSSRSGCCK